jgi:hypothetical protein
MLSATWRRSRESTSGNNQQFSIFELDADEMDFGRRYVLHRMRRKAFYEIRGRRCQHPRHRAAIEQHVAFAIAPNEIAGRDGVVDGRPAMRVDRYNMAHRNSRIQHAHAIILEHQTVILRRRDHCVERIRPRPRGFCRFRRSCHRLFHLHVGGAALVLGVVLHVLVAFHTAEFHLLILGIVSFVQVHRDFERLG